MLDTVWTVARYAIPGMLGLSAVQKGVETATPTFQYAYDSGLTLLGNSWSGAANAVTGIGEYVFYKSHNAEQWARLQNSTDYQPSTYFNYTSMPEFASYAANSTAEAGDSWLHQSGMWAGEQLADGSWGMVRGVWNGVFGGAKQYINLSIDLDDIEAHAADGDFAKSQALAFFAGGVAIAVIAAYVAKHPEQIKNAATFPLRVFSRTGEIAEAQRVAALVESAPAPAAGAVVEESS